MTSYQAGSLDMKKINQAGCIAAGAIRFLMASTAFAERVPVGQGKLDDNKPISRMQRQCRPGAVHLRTTFSGLQRLSSLPPDGRRLFAGLAGDANWGTTRSRSSERIVI